MDFLFLPGYRHTKRFRDDQYEFSQNEPQIIGGKKGKGMVFTQQQALDIQRNNLKISADGSINTHNDVNTMNVQNGQTLVWDGTNWTNTLITISQDSQANNLKISADGSVNTHNDVNFSNPVLGDILTWDGTNWTNRAAGVSPQEALDIQRNNLKISADGSINTHNDVNTVLPTPGQILAWDGANWTNINVAQSSLTGVTSYFPTLPSGVLTRFRPQGFLPSRSGHAGYGTFNAGIRLSAATFPDGTIPGINLCTCTNAQLTSHLFISNGNDAAFTDQVAMNGLERVYNLVNPFPDVFNPTMLQLMLWNVEVINHFRRICGNPIPIVLDKRLNYEALWSVERVNTNYHGARWNTTALYNQTFIPSTTIQNSVYGLPLSEVSSTQTNNFPVALFQRQNELKLSGYQMNINVGQECPWNLHMVSIIRFWVNVSGVFYNSIDANSLLIAALLTRTHIGMCVHLEPTSNQIFYRFTFSGPILNRCFT